jgi:hypothetical protein
LGWAELHNFATLLAESERLRAALVRASELDRVAERRASDHLLGILLATEHGTPDRLLGILLATIPADAGGDLRAAEERFEAAMAAAPDCLATPLAYAERYAVRIRDGALYRRLLERVLAGDPNRLPDAAPENRAAQRRARQLLDEQRR